MNPKSPMRLVTNAFLPAEALASLPNQNEIKQGTNRHRRLPPEEGHEHVVAQHEDQHREREQG
jgi:hypothetical protein